MEKEEALVALVKLTNENLGYVPTTPSEFNELSRRIQSKTGRGLSLSSIKRIWGYVSYTAFPTVTTLNTLSQFNDFNDWETFLNFGKPDNGEDSDFMNGSAVKADDLKEGDYLLLEWGSGKGCEIECIGSRRFRVVASSNIKLQPGDEFTLHTLCIGHPVFVSDIERGEERIPAYVGAKKGGLISWRLKEK